MSAVLVTALRVAFLGLMWVFILLAANVIRTDMFGRRVAVPSAPEQPTSSSDGAVAAATTPATPARISRRQRRRGPTTLAVTEGRSAGTRLGLVEGLDGTAARVVIGRAQDATVPIDDDYASGHHAQLVQLSDGSWVVDDLNSTNGTYVNEVRVTVSTPVTVNDDIRIGRTHLRLEK